MVNTNFKDLPTRYIDCSKKIFKESTFQPLNQRMNYFITSDTQPLTTPTGHFTACTADNSVIALRGFIIHANHHAITDTVGGGPQAVRKLVVRSEGTFTRIRPFSAESL